MNVQMINQELQPYGYMLRVRTTGEAFAARHGSPEIALGNFNDLLTKKVNGRKKIFDKKLNQQQAR